MKGKLLAFKPQDDYDQQLVESSPDSELTGLELFQKLDEFGQEHLLRVIKAYKSTGGWNPTAEKIATRVSENLKALSANVAGAHDAKKKPAVQETPQAVVNFVPTLVRRIPLGGSDTGGDDRHAG